MLRDHQSVHGAVQDQARHSRLAQVRDQRGRTDAVENMRARVEYDLEYPRHGSFGLDFKIMVATIELVFFDRHAY
jgi:putative colanic acid biosynthesis UDP-glucose lipid carrier transferase